MFVFPSTPRVCSLPVGQSALPLVTALAKATEHLSVLLIFSSRGAILSFEM